MSATASIGDRLLGKVAVITGAGSGFGAAMAAAMRAQGARVVVGPKNVVRALAHVVELDAFAAHAEA
jgi:3-oxoacyl-[acyl-carrier protein] reductase